jgi:anthranilate phosphoribosyltransferase
MSIQDAIAKVIDRIDLTMDESADALKNIMSGDCTPAQIAGLLVALRMKGETVDEITGFAQTMREFSATVVSSRTPLVDTCGTGGDGSGTFNISTTAAFVVAGAGVAVAKHGNRSASSKCGSADVLETLGVNIDATPETVGKCIDECGIGFLFARSHHPAMKHVAAPRMELKTRTIFNFLGPLTNPANATRQVMGVFDKSRITEIAQVLLNLGAEKALVVAGEDGLDEITLCGNTHVAEAVNGQVSTYDLNPEDFGFAKVDPDTLLGGEAEENAAILKSVLGGEMGPKRDVVLLNAGAAIYASTDDISMEESIQKAKDSIDSGAASAKLAQLVSLSNR